MDDQRALLENWLKEELLTSECCKERLLNISGKGDKSKLSTLSDEKIIEIDLSSLSEFVDEAFLRRVTEKYRLISLRMTQNCDLSEKVLSLVSEYISPKLIELSIEDCNKLSWRGQVKKLLDRSTAVEVINFRRNNWVNDYVVEQLSIKFAKTLHVLNLEHNEITDNALYHIGRRCLQLRSLCLNCCAKITDIGLVELSRRIHLSSVDISHNVNISDSAIEVLLSAAAPLDEIKLTNCPRLTDHAVEALYEALAPWGKKRNVKAQKLKLLELRDNINFTSQIMVWLSVTAPSLTTLDLRDCPRIDLSKGLRELQILSQIKHIFFGPSEILSSPEEFVNCMLVLIPKLHTLHLSQIPGIEDEDIAEILESSRAIDDLLISGIDVGTLTVEALCSNVPNVTKVAFIDNRKVQDMDVRCLTQVCANLSSLTLQQCERLTDDAFIRCTSLAYLKELNLSRMSRLHTGALLQYFPQTALEKLSLDGLGSNQIRTVLAHLNRRNRETMRTLSLRDCPQLTAQDVSYILSNFPLCCSFDFTGCGAESKMQEPASLNPLLTFASSVDFTGFIQTPQQQFRHSRFLAIQRKLREWAAARKIASLTKHRKAIRAERSKWLQIFRLERQHIVVTKIQSRFRARKVRREAQRLLRAARVVTHLAQRYINLRNRRHDQKAREQYMNRLLRRVFLALAMGASQSRAMLRLKEESVVTHMQVSLVRRQFLHFVNARTDHEDMLIGSYARVFWEKNILRTILRHWRTTLGSSAQQRLSRVKAIPLILQECYHNSIRQQRLRELAENFKQRRLLLPAWLCLCDDWLRGRMAESKFPFAAAHFDHTFFRRIMPIIIEAFVWHMGQRRLKKQYLVKGGQHWRRQLLVRGFRSSGLFILRTKAAKAKVLDAKQFYRRRRMRTAFVDDFYYFVRNSIFCKETLLRFPDYYEQRLYWKSRPIFMENIRKMFVWKAMKKRAVAFSVAKIRRKLFGFWREETIRLRHSDQIYFQRYLLKLEKKVFAAMKQFVANLIGFRADLKKRLANHVKDAEELKKRFERALQMMVRFQAIVRGGQARKHTRIFRVESIFAALTIQKTVRRHQARKRFKWVLRKRDIEEIKKETTENDLMRKEDEDSFYYRYHWLNALAIQKMYRGFKGRVRAAYLAAIRFRDNQSEFYRRMVRIRELYENTLRAIAARNKFKANCATILQRRYRGMLGRRVFAQLKLEKRQNEIVVRIQRAYRFRLAGLKLQSLRRHYACVQEARAVYRRRGAIMHMMGFTRKKKTRVIAYRRLQALGLDPMSFNFYPFNLLMETVNDFRRFVDVTRREIKLFREHPTDSLARQRERRKVIISQGKSIQLNDCVRITDTDHHYCGYTGVVVKVHLKVQGLPVYEIKLDGFPHITYVRMTADALAIYEASTLPLKLIQAYPKIGKIRQPFQVYGLHPVDDLFCKKNISAAWKIQLAFRRYRARKVLARRRYEQWVREAAIHGNLLYHLADANALNTRGYKLVRKLRGAGDTRRRRPVEFQGLMQPPVPTRMTIRKAKTAVERNMMHEEVATRIRDRQAFLMRSFSNLQESFYFMKGYNRITWRNKVAMFLRAACGVFMKSGKSVGSVSGNRGALVLAKQKSIVNGMDVYPFPSFAKSPHVRYHKLCLYQGDWSGIPLFTSLQPHGEGLIMFLEAWGFSREDKVVFLTIKQCRYLMSAGDVQTDPYCDIHCNRTHLQSSIKRNTTDPIFLENFEVDVTNPREEVVVEVRERPLTVFSKGAFLGQVILTVGDYGDGKVHNETLQLQGQNRAKKDKVERGEIELSIQWTDRMYEEDMEMADYKLAKVLQLQSWSRRMAAEETQRKLQIERQQLVQVANDAAITVTGAIRIKLAKKLVRQIRRKNRSALKIQKRVRIFLAKRELVRRRIQRRAAIIIQTRARVVLAKNELIRLRKKRAALLKRCATVIQKWIRRLVAQCVVWRERRVSQGMLPESDDESDGETNEEEVEKEGESKIGESSSLIESSEEGLTSSIHLSVENAESVASDAKSSTDLNPVALLERQKRARAAARLAAAVRRRKWLQTLIDLQKPVAAWIDTYGTDPIYGSKRSRRIMDKAFLKLLNTKYATLLTRFGLVYIKCHPTPATVEDSIREANGELPLCNRDHFVLVYIPPFVPYTMHRQEAIKLIEEVPHEAYVHIPTSVMSKDSIVAMVVRIQCAARQKEGRKYYKRLLKARDAFIKLQRQFRNRYQVYNRAAYLITASFKFSAAKKILRLLRLERKCAIMIQCCYRKFLARCEMFNNRCVTEVSVLKYTSAAEYHNPNRLLDWKFDTLWVAETKESADIRFEFRKRERISELFIQAGTFGSSPAKISVYTVLDKASKKFEPLVENRVLPLLRGRRWHRVPIEPTLSKYFKVTFTGNHGHETDIAVRQIRFLRCREKSVRIIQQPENHPLEQGPPMHSSHSVRLTCLADGWPYPTFQWFRGETMIEGATRNFLDLTLTNLPTKKFKPRFYRCSKCRLITSGVPFNAYHVECGQCGCRFIHKEIKEYLEVMNEIRGLETPAEAERKEASEVVRRFEEMCLREPKNEAFKIQLKEAQQHLKVFEDRLLSLRTERMKLKRLFTHAFRFTQEGIYSCQVKNIRGGSVIITRHSKKVAVTFDRPAPYVMSMHPEFVPRKPHRRRNWNIYQSLLGTINKGRVVGMVSIRYLDGSLYEGPYVAEEWIDLMGRVPPEAREKNHYGVYTNFDGRIFEGQNVDNHFDPDNLQTYYRVKYPDGNRYEGKFCDEFYHGLGVLTEPNGTVYEGEWHRGRRFGHGQLRSHEGWTYEGDFVRGKRHGSGINSWPDGSMYIGVWREDRRTGRGMYLSPLRDLYKGDFVDDLFDGYGELFYASGTKYIGQFKAGKRHGRGILQERSGNEYYGNFENDLKDGEFIVKEIITLYERGHPNYEIKIGLFKMGQFVRWLLRFSNSVLTREFCRLFKEGRNMFDSTYGKLVAAHLPNLPDGVDPLDEEVQEVVTKLRVEAGVVVEHHKIVESKEKVALLEENMQQNLMEQLQLQNVLNELSAKATSLRFDMFSLKKQFTRMFEEVDKVTRHNLQYWNDEPEQTEYLFKQAIQNLEKVHADDFFSFRKHRIPPPFTKKIVMAISMLMGIPIAESWTKMQIIVADSIYNRREREETALIADYACKLLYLMKDYNVLEYCQLPDGVEAELLKILHDPRFRPDGYYIESCGAAAPKFVVWVKANYKYIKAAQKIYPRTVAAEEKKINAFRLKSVHEKKSEEARVLQAEISSYEKRLKQLREQHDELKSAHHQGLALIQFLEETAKMFKDKEPELDYYQKMEKHIEEQKVRFETESLLKVMVGDVDQRVKTYRMKQAKAKDLVVSHKVIYEELDASNFQLKTWLSDFIAEEQKALLDAGSTLGYAYGRTPESPLSVLEFQDFNDSIVNPEVVYEAIDRVVRAVSLRFNDAMNEHPSCTTWYMPTGRVVTIRSLYIIAWKYWGDVAREIEDKTAMDVWEGIFPDPEECMRRAVESRYNNRMSRTAREQGKVWARRHPKEVAQAEALFSEEFAVEYPEDTATWAIQLSTEFEERGADPGVFFDPTVTARCFSWMRLHPDEVQRARDEARMVQAQEFERKFAKDTAEMSFNILQGIGNDENLRWASYAQSWRDFHTEEYEETAQKLITEMAKDFAIKRLAEKAAMDAATIVEQESIARMIIDEETAKTHKPSAPDYLRANSWGVRNQGYFKAALAKVKADNYSTATRHWNELCAETDQLQKGSYLFTSEEMKADPRTDRFFNFRRKQLLKNHWLYGYLCKLQADLIKELTELEQSDPSTKLLYNARPSEVEKIRKEEADKHRHQKKIAEAAFADVMAKLAAWNTYFGPFLNGEYSRGIVAWGATVTPGEGGSVASDKAAGEEDATSAFNADIALEDLN